MSASPAGLVATHDAAQAFDNITPTLAPRKTPSHAYHLSFIEQLTANALPICDILEMEHQNDHTQPQHINALTVDELDIQMCTIPSSDTLDDTVIAETVARNRPTSISPVAVPSFNVNDSNTPQQRTREIHRIRSVSDRTVASTSAIDFNIMNARRNKIPVSYITLYYLLRSFSILVTLFLAIMAINYAIGQIYGLSAADLFCPNMDEDTVRDYNLKNNLPQGAQHCGKINRPEIDDYKLRYGDPYEPITNFSSVNILSCIAFLLLFLCLSVLGIYHLIICFYDGFFHFVKRTNNNPRIVRALRPKKNKASSTCARWWNKWNLFVLKRYYPDSKWKIIALIMSQVTEILLQCWALAIYGGVQNVSLSFVLANEPRFVQRFAIIIGANGIINGILWILYVLQLKSLNVVFQGTSFQSIVFVIDMLFEFAFTIFPFTLYSGNKSLLFNLKALATLNSENGVLFFAAFVAMVLLFQKCVTVLRSFNPVAIQLRAKKLRIHNIDLIPYLQPTYAETSTSDSEEDYKQWQTQQRHRKLCIGSFGAIFVIFGIALITVISLYISNAHEICTNPSPQLLTQHPELYYWNEYCETKLLPFKDSTSIPCDCRTMDITFTVQHYKEYNFSTQHITSIMSNFEMLTFLALGYHPEFLAMINHMSADTDGGYERAQALFYLNLTSNCFLSKKLNSLSLYRTFLIDVDWKALSSLKWLQVLLIWNGIYRNPVDWDSIGRLSTLKYLNLRESNVHLAGAVSDSICQLTELKYLNIETNMISSIPDCIADLKHLYGINLRGLPNLKYITPELFKLESIVTVMAYYGGFNASSIPSDGWGKSLETVFLQETPLCNEVNTMTQSQMEFMDTFNPCYKPCSASEGLHAWCATYDWGDGLCSDDCCNYDGGDCHQTCACDRSLWFNDECDAECNNTLCAYDFGDCLPTKYTNDSGDCVSGSSCFKDWQNDGWCDNNCAILNDDECGDEYDCNADNQCSEGSQCGIAYLYLIHNGASNNDPKELIDINETCTFWDFIKLIDPNLGSCTEEFPLRDLNHDNYISFWEAIQLAAGVLGLTAQKAEQVNCSLCLKDPSLYY